jgi:hypothetical protein
MGSKMPPAAPLGSCRIAIEGLQVPQNVDHVSLRTLIRQKIRRFGRSKTSQPLEQVGCEATITVDGQSNLVTVTMTMSEDEPISQLWKHIEG